MSPALVAAICERHFRLEAQALRLQRSASRAIKVARACRRANQARVWKSAMPGLMQCARVAIVEGRMPDRRQTHTWGGLSAGLPCPVCEKTITDDDVEVEMEFDGRAHLHYHLHFRCFTAWEVELKRSPHP